MSDEDDDEETTTEEDEMSDEDKDEKLEKVALKYQDIITDSYTH